MYAAQPKKLLIMNILDILTDEANIRMIMKNAVIYKDLLNVE